ncbi:CHAT domain-containing protein [Mycena galopus ATCC 62051]|nr:CHAT domain-containing protein [Mycena galopus ATCC 62051]
MSISLHFEALNLRPDSHPARCISLNNLAAALTQRVKSKNDSSDLDRAIDLHREALDLCPAPHPHRAVSLNNLANSLLHKYDNSQHSHIMEEVVLVAREASTYPSCSPSLRYEISARWARVADKHHHHSALEAYGISIGLLPQLAMLGIDIQSRRRVLTSKTNIGLASDAATCASRFKNIEKVVEFLEAGRSVFWSQGLQIHTSLEDLYSAHPLLARRLSDISKQLELGSHRDVVSLRMLPPQNKEHMILDKEDTYYRTLNSTWVQVLQDVQQQPGFEGFLRPKSLKELKNAASGGPVVILNAGTLCCTAFIMGVSGDVQRVNLEKMTWKRAQQLGELLHALLQESEVAISQLLTKMQTRTESKEPSPIQPRLKGKLEDSDDDTVNKVFAWMLGELWTSLVQPIILALGLKGQSLLFICVKAFVGWLSECEPHAEAHAFHAPGFQRSDKPDRLWWCPTGLLTSLPIHAAGLYSGDETDCVSDYVISSYTPTLTALLNPPTNQTSSPFKVTTVIQPVTPGFSDLPGTTEELARIQGKVPKEWLTILGDTSPSTVKIALIHLRESSITHFACHGIQDIQNPLDSGLILTDGRLKVSELMHGDEDVKSRKERTTLAFLSACETAKGDENVPDEAMHLAATFLFIGYRAVVATMWRIAETFYEHLFKDCDATAIPPILPDLTKSAEALHAAVTKLRADPNVEFKRWVPFVHYGV